MCAGSIDGIVQTGIFFFRNSGKVASGKDTGRVGAAAAQLGSLTDKVADEASIFGSTVSGGASGVLKTLDKGVLALTDKIGCTDAAVQMAKKAGTNSVFGAVAQKAVNPLLITAAGIRILNDDDQYAALIEEGCAMGAMFGMEKLMKTAKTSFFEAAENGAKAIEGTGRGGFLSGLKNAVTKGIKQAAGAYSKLGSGKQAAVKAGIGLLFVAGSIGAYTLGQTLGKKLSGRDKK